jgi:hypothetical protein
MIMSTIESFVHASGGYAPRKRQGRAAAAAIVGAVGLYWQAIRDGLAALRRYNQLTTRGVAHEAAVREIFVEHFCSR